MTYLETLIAFKGDCVAAMRNIADAAAADEERTDGKFTDTEQADWDQLERWLADADPLIERHEKLAKLAETVPEAPEAGQRGDVLPSFNVNQRGSDDPFDLRTVPVTASTADMVARAETAIEKMDHANDDAREAASQTLSKVVGDQRAVARHYLATGSDAYRSAFFKLLGGPGHVLTEAEGRAVEEARAASLTNAAGGFAVPFTLDPSIILTNAGTANPFRQISRTVQITTDQWNGVSTAGVTASWDGEAAEVSDDAPTLAQPSIDVEKAQAFIPFSIEIGMDWQNFQSDAAMLFSDAKDRLEGAAFATGAGSGSDQPTGIVTELSGGSYETATATNDVFALADVYSVFEALQVRHRSSASWVMNLGILNDVRQFGTANNYNGFTVDLTAAGIPQLLGRPVYESSDMASAVADGADIAVVGNFDHYVIVDRVGMSVELVPHLFATGNNRPSGQRGFYAWWRVGAGSVNDAAFRLLTVQ